MNSRKHAACTTKTSSTTNGWRIRLSEAASSYLDLEMYMCTCLVLFVLCCACVAALLGPLCAARVWLRVCARLLLFSPLLACLPAACLAFSCALRVACCWWRCSALLLFLPCFAFAWSPCFRMMMMIHRTTSTGEAALAMYSARQFFSSGSSVCRVGTGPLVERTRHPWIPRG